MKLETKRLFLREFEIEDATSLYDLNLDPEVIKYTGDPPFESVKYAENFIENYDSYRVNGFGRWAVIRKEDGTFLGWCGLKINEENQVDLGFRFFKKYWSQGFATESAQASLAYGFNTLDIPEIVGRAVPDNTASIVVLKKLGMQFWKKSACHGIAGAHYYRLTIQEYLKNG